MHNTHQRTDVIKVAEGMKYLPQSVLDAIQRQSDYEAGLYEDHPLIQAVSKFDTHFEYSDCGNTYRRGLARKKELEEQITNSEFSSEDRVILRGGLSMDSELRANFHQRFPITTISPTGLPDAYKLITVGGYDEVRVELILNELRGLRGIVTKGGKPIDNGIAWTRHAPNFVKKLKGKVCLPRGTQDILSSTADILTNIDIEYLNKVIALCSGYHTVPGHDYVIHMSTLPYVGNIRIDNTPELSEHLVYTYSLGSNEGNDLGYRTTVGIKFYSKDNLRSFFSKIMKKKGARVTA